MKTVKYIGRQSGKSREIDDEVGFVSFHIAIYNFLLEIDWLERNALAFVELVLEFDPMKTESM